MMLVSGRVCEVFFTSNPSAYHCHSLRGCVILSVVVNLRFAFSDVYSVFRIKGVFLAFLWSFRRRKTAGSLQLGETGFNYFYWRDKKMPNLSCCADSATSSSSTAPYLTSLFHVQTYACSDVPYFFAARLNILSATCRLCNLLMLFEK